MAMSIRTVASGSLITVVLLCASSGLAAQCWVPSDDYPSIQSAVDDVTCTDIVLATGFHVGDVVIWRGLTMTGDSPDATAVVGTITVEGETTEVTLNDFHIDMSSEGLPYNGLEVIGNATVVTSGGSLYLITDCSYTIDPASATYDPPGGFGTVAVTAQVGCPWVAVSNVGWVTVTSGSSGTGPGTVSYDVSANSSPNPRTGTLTVAGQTFTIEQAGITCSYSIEPTFAIYEGVGGSGAITVTTQDECPWTAVSNVAWATVTSGASGTGPGTVSYDVSVNTSPDPRTGTLTVAGRTFTIHQEGFEPDIFADGFESGDTSRWSATVP